MAEGKVKINTEMASTVVNSMSNESNTLESEVLPKLSSDFSRLTDIGFATSCISKIKDQISSVVEIEKQIVSSIDGGRHLVTVVGFDASVQSYKDLTSDEILVIDCVDGKIQTLSERNRKLFNQDKQFFARGATDTFLSKEVYTVS